MDLNALLPKRWPRTKRLWALAAAVVVVALVALVVPLAILLPKKGSKPAPASVILPLYIYPHDSSTWRPVYDALALRPNLHFTVIVNPDSGPGDGALPNEQYTEAVAKLSSYPNAELLGYVRTGYATRNITEVLGDINVYAGWSSSNSSLAMHGIFLDEAPHEYSASAVDFLRRVGQSIKSATGLQGPKRTIYNPGTIPDTRFDEVKPDVTVVFEDDYGSWQASRQAVAALPPQRSAYGLMINSVPPMSSDGLRDFVRSLSNIAEHLFITTNREGFYESIADRWVDFINSVPV